MAAAIVEPSAERDGTVDRLAVEMRALGQDEAGKARGNTRLDRAANGLSWRAGNLRTIVAVLISRPIAVDPQALEVGVHDEVDDTRNRVGAIHRRGAAGEHFNPLYQ